MRWLCCTSLLLLFAIPAFAQTSASEFLALEEQLARALTTKDAAALERLLAPDFVMR